MNRLRRWATPLVTGSFLLVAVTGLLLFFRAATPLARVAHEWLSWILVVAGALHALVNARALGAALRRRPAQLAVAAFAALTLGLAVPLLTGARVDPEYAVLEALLRAPLPQVAALAGRAPAELRASLEQQGLRVPSEASPLEEIARASGAHPPDVLAAAFAPRK